MDTGTAASIGWLDIVELLLAAGFGVGVFIWAFDRWEKRLTNKLRSARHRQDLNRRYGANYAEGYYITLSMLLRWADRFYGPELSWRAFDRCLLFAYIYPFIFAVIGWMIYQEPSPGGIEIIENADFSIGRARQAAPYAAILALTILTYHFSFHAFDRSKNRRILFSHSIDQISLNSDKMGQASIFTKLIFSAFTGIGAVFLFIFAVLVSLFLSDFGPKSYAPSNSHPTMGFLIFYAVFAFSISASIAAAIAGASAVLFVVIGIMAITASGAEPVFEFPLFVFVILPLTNSLADWTSLIITRRLLLDLENRRHTSSGLAFHLLIDVAAAFTCMAILLIGMSGLLKLWATLSPQSVLVDPSVFWSEARRDPREGFVLWLMCFTTLIPTFVHGGMAVTLWKVRTSDYTKAALTRIQTLPANPADADLDDISDLLRKGQLSGFLRGAIWWGIALAAVFYLGYLIVMTPNGA